MQPCRHGRPDDDSRPAFPFEHGRRDHRLCIGSPPRPDAHPLVKLGVGRADIGYWVLRERRGQGVATEALDLVATHTLTVMPLQRVSLFIEPWNIGSRRTAERAGFEEEALLTAWETYDDGEPRDMHVYARTRADGPPR